MRNINVVIVLFLWIALSGCAGKMPLVKGAADQVNISDKSIILLPVRISNQYKAGYQPNLDTARFYNKPNYQPEFAKTMTDGTKWELINLDKGFFKSEKNQYNEYLLSFSRIKKPLASGQGQSS